MMRYYCLLCLFMFNFPGQCQVNHLYVSPGGNDTNAGTMKKPVKSLQKALLLAGNFAGKKADIQLLGGTYYLEETIKIVSTDRLPSDLRIKAYAGQRVIISAGRRLKPDWQFFKDGIYKAYIPADVLFERLYVNGRLQTLARYPNADTTAGVFNGTAEDATYYVRVLNWGNPYGGYVHALDENKRGSLHYKITGVDDTDNVELEGGLPYNKAVHWDKKNHFVENILGELDQPGEWYLDRTLGILYYFPSAGTDLSKAVVEVSHLKNSIELLGSIDKPLKNIQFRGLEFRHNERTFRDNRAGVRGSDWPVYRGGSLLLSGTENCTIEGCTFIGVGGNAIMLSGYNKLDTVRNCFIAHTGASAVSMIAEELTGHDKTFSRECAITGNTIRHVGEIEKRGSGIHLSGAQKITASGNSIYHVPGIAIRQEATSSGDSTRLINNRIAGEYREIKQ
jgi:hypothetical protein